MSRTVALAAVTFALAAAPAAADDYAAVARNIIPSGQYGSVPPPPGADEQALMYDALTPLFDQVSSDDLMTKFKSEGFGVGPDGPARPEPLPRAGVTVVRDRFNVPHITGQSRDDVTWAMGWLLQQDRGIDLLLTDLAMPRGMTGRQLAEAARMLRPGLPVLFMSGDTDDRVTPDSGSPDGPLVRKPFTRTALAQAVQAALAPRAA